MAVPLTTVLLVAARSHLSLADDLLVYLLLVVAVTVVGGFWPAVASAMAASLLLNWFFTEPLHTLSIDAPQSLLALPLFVSVAITVSSVVHLAARRAADAARSSAEAAALLDLAQTVLGGADSPRAILDQLTARSGGAADLLELVGEDWVPVAMSRASAGSPAARQLHRTRAHRRPGSFCRRAPACGYASATRYSPWAGGRSTASPRRSSPPSNATGCAPKPPRPRCSARPIECEPPS